MDVRNWVIDRRVFLAASILISCASCVGAASAQSGNSLPPGDVLATVYYTSFYSYPASSPNTAQAAAAISEQSIQTNDSYLSGNGVTITDTFGPIQA